VASGDFDGDGKPDFVVLVQYGNSQFPFPSPLATAAWVFFGNGDGTFAAPVLAGKFNRNYTKVAATDLNRDGLSDMVLSTSGSLAGGYSVGVVDAESGRRFAGEMNYTAGTGLSSLAITDLNGDGFPDLLFANGDFNQCGGTQGIAVDLIKSHNRISSGIGNPIFIAVLTAVGATVEPGDPAGDRMEHRF
jgi:hypothetical protein